MTTVNYLDKTDLHLALSPFTLDAASQQAVIQQLITDGLYNTSNPDDGTSVWVESDLYNGVVQPPLFGAGGNPTVPPFVQVLEIQGSITNVQTDSALKIIVDDGVHPSLLNVYGNDPVFIALGTAGVTVNLNGLGNDTVLGGSGADSITGNGAADLLIGGGGNDTLTDSGGHSTLVGGGGNDTINGVQGDTFQQDTTTASGMDVYNIHDGPGNSTINLGLGGDTVNFFTTTGNDTINHGGGTDTVDFTKSATNVLADIQTITPGTGAQKGDYTILFTDGQSVTLNAHSASASQNAFVVEFKDGNLNLKGGT